MKSLMNNFFFSNGIILTILASAVTLSPTFLLFDTVPHRRFIVKLESYGLNGNILNWLKGFLSGRSQVVKVNGADSKSTPVFSGIPQGSVLGHYCL